jgi:hypothetical protein
VKQSPIASSNPSRDYANDRNDLRVMENNHGHDPSYYLQHTPSLNL